MREEIRKLQSVLQEAQRLGEAGQHAESKALLKQAKARCHELGIESATICWSLAVACDYSGCPEEALVFIAEVMNMDPVSNAGLSSLRIIAGRVRDALGAPDRDPVDADTPQSCALLLQFGEADARVHLAAARYEAAKGHLDRALSTLQALCVLEPENETALRELVDVAKQAGRQDVVREASATLLGLKTQRRGDVLLLTTNGGVHALA